MKQHLVIEGMACEACKAKIKYLFEQHKTVELAHVDLASGQVTLDVEQILSETVFESILLGHDKYSILQEEKEVKDLEVESFWITYKPLLLVAIFVAVVSATAVLNSSTPSFMLWMRYFMAGFFISFSFFKFLDLKGFANSFCMYDPLAMRVKAYGKIYPFIELSLGLLFLIEFNPIVTNLATILILGISTIGVIQSVVDKRKIQCACIGTVFNLPMSKVTIIENSIMIGMAITMIIVKSI